MGGFSIRKIERKCLNCGNTFEKYLSRIKSGRGKFCSRKCTDDYKRINGLMSLENNPAWKGTKVGYGGLHKWLNKYNKKLGICRICKNNKKTAFAKVNEYSRDINDYWELCYVCHGFFDRGYSVEAILSIVELKRILKSQGHTGAIRLSL